MAPRTDWNPVLRSEFSAPYWAPLHQFVADERARGPVYPPHDEVFASLHLTPLASIRAVILGQDPYHGPGQAHGLCFSVKPPTPPPPSLKNIFRELHTDLGLPIPTSGSLIPWAEQGVLLLNTVLTVRGGEANSHRQQGWENFTDAVIDAVNAKPDRVVFILWGTAAQRKIERLDLDRHATVTSPHPSPLSASRGFFGSRPFSATNRLLAARGLSPIDWQLP
ncbi:MAG: uracil-DNA glycosylase [Acidimicrobiales bacterium]|nr:uracil-DNA glycosylase [Acidimicrobiales bacterium]